jgi:SAM-dependent methyltransferase
VTTGLLTDLWRIHFRVDARASLAGLDRIGLWESPTGLYFFDPPCEGDRAFYSQFYDWVKARGLFTDRTVRVEFLIAAERISPGARVLDVGCGDGNFRQCVPRAEYTGLDPNIAGNEAAKGVRSETLERHLAANACSYDAVCCFQVIEHVRVQRLCLARSSRQRGPAVSSASGRRMCPRR